MEEYKCMIYQLLECCYRFHNWPWFERNDHPCDCCPQSLNYQLKNAK